MSVRPYKDKHTGEIVPRKWIIDVYPQGRKGKRIMQVVEDMDQADAVAIAARIRRAENKPIPTDPKIIDIYPEWLRHYSIETAPGTVRDVRGAYLRLMPHFGQIRISQLVKGHFITYMENRSKDLWKPPQSKVKPRPISRRTINKELTYLSALITWAINEYRLPDLPFIIPKYKKVKPAKLSIPGTDEITRLAQACNPLARLVVYLYHDSGLRRSEALQLTAQQIHLETWTLDILGKGHKWRTVPITTNRLHQALEDRLKEIKHQGHLFLNHKTKVPYKDMRKAITAAADRAGINRRIYNHLFRHTHATNSLDAGLDLETIRENLGHEDIKTTQVYMHLRTKHRQAAAKKLARLIEGPPPKAKGTRKPPPDQPITTPANRKKA